MDKGHRLFLLELMQEMVTCGRPATAARLRAAAERIRVLGEKNTALLAVADAAKKVVKHTADFDLETALARLDGEVGEVMDGK